MTCNFDWYQATLDEVPRTIADAVAAAFPETASVEDGRGRNGYSQGLYVRDGEGEIIASIFSGGMDAPPNCFASGSNAQRFAGVIREHWPSAHKVTRLDSAADVPGEFWDLVGKLKPLAQAKGLKFRTWDEGDPADGSTFYIGSKASRVMCRLYEKGKELRAKGHPVTDEQLGLVRFEVQLRPTKEGRLTAAILEPSQAWGATHWTRDLALNFIGVDASRQPMQFKLLSAFEQKVGHMTNAYGATLRELRKRAGTPLGLALVLSYLLDGEGDE